MATCNCLKEVEEKIKEKTSANETNPKGYKIVDANWERMSWFPKLALYAVYLIRSTFEKKDGTTSRPRNEHINIFFNYCPFCGVKMEEQERIIT